MHTVPAKRARQFLSGSLCDHSPARGKKPDSDTARDEDRDRDRDVLTDTLSGKQGRIPAGPVLTDTLSGEGKNVPVLPPPGYRSINSRPWYIYIL